MQTRKLSRAARISSVALPVALLMVAAPAFPADQPDHAAMDHSMMNMERDEEGRTLHGMKHQMDPALTKEVRERVPLYNNYTDAQIALSMDMMGSEYAWYISPPGLKGSEAVLILLHGFGDQGDKIFKDRMASIGNIFPTSMGVGMAMMMSQHIQVALDDLKAAGAKIVVVVPVTSTDTNELYRQWLYILGRNDKVEYASVPKVKTDADLRIVPPPGDAPVVAEILLDYAMELSTDPKKEVVIIAGHGPTPAADNANEMRQLANLAKIVQEDGGFSAVYGQTLQDDSPPEIRAGNVAKLRAMVENATKDGKRVIIVTNLIGARTIQAKLRDDLKGLDYKFNPKGIVQHDNFLKWMGEGIRHELERKAAL